MQEVNLYQFFTDKLNDSSIKYAVTGSVAAIIYGEPRTTHDIDIVIENDLKDVNKLISIFPENEFYCPPVEVLKTEILRSSRGHCNIIHHKTGFKADVYFCGKSEFEKWAVENSKPIKYNSKQILIAPIEYVIVKKLEFYKEGHSHKHIEDIKAIIQNSKEMIDFPLLENFLNKFNLQNEWYLCNN